MKKKLAVVTTHPVQYYAPIFRMLQERDEICLKVFYTWAQSEEGVYDPNFKRAIKWDLPLLEGYDHTFLKNVSRRPGSFHYKGIDNPTIIEDLKFFAPDAILVFGWNLKSHLKVMRHFKGRVPVFFRGDSTQLLNISWSKRLLRKIALTWVYSHIDIAFYVGKRNYEYYKAHGLKAEQLVFTPHAIDNARFQNSILSGTNFRTNLGIPDSAIVFLFAGKFEVRKNPVLLVQAFIETRIQDSHLVMVGNGVYENELKALAAGYKNIHFLDFQNQQSMPLVYSVADVFVLPSQSETWGLAVNEAMACSKAVLVSDNCGCAVDLVWEGGNGYTFKSGNKLDFKEKLRLLSGEGKDILNKMGCESRKIIDNWSFNNICNSITSTVLASCNNKVKF